MQTVHILQDGLPRDGAYVLYWMQQAQRVVDNPALTYAVKRGDDLGLPVLVGFGLTPDFPEATSRHYAFMLEGLAQTADALGRLGIGFRLLLQSPPAAALELASEAALIVCDCGYLRVQRQWRQQVAAQAPCPVLAVETDTLVPVAEAYSKQAYAAAHLRRRVRPLWPRYRQVAPAPQPARRFTTHPLCDPAAEALPARMPPGMPLCSSCCLAVICPAICACIGANRFCGGGAVARRPMTGCCLAITGIFWTAGILTALLVWAGSSVSMTGPGPSGRAGARFGL